MAAPGSYQSQNLLTPPAMPASYSKPLQRQPSSGRKVSFNKPASEAGGCLRSPHLVEVRTISRAAGCLLCKTHSPGLLSAWVCSVLVAPCITCRSLAPHWLGQCSTKICHSQVIWGTPPRPLESHVAFAKISHSMETSCP